MFLSPYDYVCLSGTHSHTATEPGTPEAGRPELQDLLLDERRQRREAEQQLAISRRTHTRTEREPVERARASWATDSVLARAPELSAIYALKSDEGRSRTVDVGEREDSGRRWHDTPHTAVGERDRGSAVNEMLGSPGKSPMLRENILREMWLERRQARSRLSGQRRRSTRLSGVADGLPSASTAQSRSKSGTTKEARRSSVSAAQ